MAYGSSVKPVASVSNIPIEPVASVVQPNPFVQSLRNLFQLIVGALFGKEDPTPPVDSLSLRDIQWMDPIKWMDPIDKPMNFPHAYDDISERAFISALARIIAKTQDKRLSLESRKLKEQVEKNGLPKTRKEISKDLNNLINRIHGQISDLNLQKSACKLIIKREKDRCFGVNEIIEEHEMNIFSCKNEIARLKKIKSDLLSVIYFLKPNASMTMKPSIVKKSKIVKKSNRPKVVSSHSTEFRRGSVQPSVRKGIMGLPIKTTRVLLSSIRSDIANGTSGSEGITKRDPSQPNSSREVIKKKPNALEKAQASKNWLTNRNYLLVSGKYRRNNPSFPESMRIKKEKEDAVEKYYRESVATFSKKVLESLGPLKAKTGD